MNLDAIEEEFLKQCGSCDAGLPMQCAHSDRDYRGTMFLLVREVETLRDARSRLEDALAQSAQDLLAYKDYYGTSVAQVKHLAECARCYELRFVPGVPCPDYPTE